MVNVSRSAVNTMMVGMAVQTVQRAKDALTNSCLLGPLRVVTQPYLWFSYEPIQYQVLSLRSDGFISLRQKQAIFASRSPLQRRDGVEATARDSMPEVDESILFLLYLTLENRREITSNNSLYSNRRELPDLEKFSFQRCRLLRGVGYAVKVRDKSSDYG